MVHSKSSAKGTSKSPTKLQLTTASSSQSKESEFLKEKPGMKQAKMTDFMTTNVQKTPKSPTETNVKTPVKKDKSKDETHEPTKGAKTGIKRKSSEDNPEASQFRTPKKATAAGSFREEVELHHKIKRLEKSNEALKDEKEDLEEKHKTLVKRR